MAKKKQTKWLKPKADETGIPGFAPISEETFNLGEREQPVYVPGASRLDNNELDEILHDQTEKANAEVKSTSVHTPSKKSDREKLAEVRGDYKGWQKDKERRGTKRKFYGGFG